MPNHKLFYKKIASGLTWQLSSLGSFAMGLDMTAKREEMH